MSKIKILPDTLANKIAAGEVVERPASVVKELLENSLDAGARRIRVEADAGGKNFIKITDDGEGMTREDALMAFERHATSKLRDMKELETIRTLGFRGEALPSIASVSKVFLRTKTAADLEGSEIEIAGGRMLNVKDLAWPGGTEMEIQDLFYNVPARRKFLKSDSTEAFHIANLITHYALANPQISFTLLQNSREVIEASPVETLRERAYQLFGADFVENLIEIHAEGEVSLNGFVSKPQEQRASRDAQYLFVNGRFVRDRVLARAISEAYKNVIPPGTHPAVMLMVTVCAEEVDVNVHPAKTEVRFRRPYAISEAVSLAIRNAFTRVKPFAEFPMRNSSNSAARDQQSISPSLDLFGPSLSSPASPASLSSPPAHNFSPPAHNFSSPSDQSPEPALPRPTIVDIDDPFDVQANDAQAMRPDYAAVPPATAAPSRHIEEEVDADTPSLPAFAPALAPPIAAVENFAAVVNGCAAESLRIDATIERLPGTETIKPLGQLRDSYIVAVDDQGLMLIDQHVAHERILFEYHLERIRARELELQRLLIPETIDLTPAQLTAYEIIANDLEASGFELMRLSGRTIAIKAAPALLSANDARMLILELLTVVEREKRALTIDHFQREIAASVACRAAIKVNMPLSKEKMGWLIDELLKTQSPTNCPHGRPIILRFSMRDIERGFKRI
jgi:DNA mismatch repair protein MutL